MLFFVFKIFFILIVANINSTIYRSLEVNQEMKFFAKRVLKESNMVGHNGGNKCALIY